MFTFFEILKSYDLVRDHHRRKKNRQNQLHVEEPPRQVSHAFTHAAKVAASETMRHLFMRRMKARERGFGFRLPATTSYGVAERVPRFGVMF